MNGCMHVFPTLKAGHVDPLIFYNFIYFKDYLLDYFSRKCYDYVINCNLDFF